MRRTTVVAALVLAALGLSTGKAAADGLPVLGIDDGAKGVAVGPARYVTFPAGRRTFLERVATHGGSVQAFAWLRGNFTIPAVAYDGSAGGLSADGRTLVLINPRTSFPRASTPLAIVDVRRMTVRKLVTLHGDYSFDAISPDGAFLYFIHYLSAQDPNRYEVRAFDVRTARLVAKPVVDPTAPGERMHGAPVTRTTSIDGAWAYTLYDGGGGTPFVHALDTRTRTARCIDLDALAGRNDLYELRLALAGGTLTVAKGGRPLVSIGTTSFEVRSPSAPSGRSFRVPWTPLAAGTLLAAALLAAAVALRRRRPPALPEA